MGCDKFSVDTRDTTALAGMSCFQTCEEFNSNTVYISSFSTYDVFSPNSLLLWFSLKKKKLEKRNWPQSLAPPVNAVSGPLLVRLLSSSCLPNVFFLSFFWCAAWPRLPAGLVLFFDLCSSSCFLLVVALSSSCPHVVLLFFFCVSTLAACQHVNMTTRERALQSSEALARQLQKETPEANVLSLSSCCPLLAGF